VLKVALKMRLSHVKKGNMPVTKRLSMLKALALTLLCSLALSGFSQDGETLFKQNCASCHKVDKDGTGPWIKDARVRWSENSEEGMIYEWVRNSTKVINEGDAYANSLFKKWGTIMTPMPSLSNEDIDKIFDYVDTYVPSVPVGSPGDGVAGGVAKDTGLSLWVYALLIFLLIVAIAATSIRRQLQKADNAANGIETPDTTYKEEVKAWVLNNKAFSFIMALLIILGGLSFLISSGGSNFGSLFGIGVYEGYKPEQPIAFSHKIHAGDNGIDCRYCHNSAEKSKHSGIPTVNVCMNCHKDIREGKITGKKEIAKIYEAIGFNAETGMYDPNAERTPIIWTKVHNLPDLAYFNHSQHVNVADVDCQQCHGDMKKETVARQMPIAELNALEGNIDLGNKNTLTMGWCIECHAQSEVSVKDNGGYYEEIHKRLLNDKELYKQYLEDGKISVSELGGWECGKCHY
jgi:cytochrome c551/c552